jgi:hypothetical protein
LSIAVYTMAYSDKGESLSTQASVKPQNKTPNILRCWAFFLVIF